MFTFCILLTFVLSLREASAKLKTSKTTTYPPSSSLQREASYQILSDIYRDNQCIKIVGFSCRSTARRKTGKEILVHIMHEGLSGGIAGLVQVITMMWLRTTVNYQYRYGVPLNVALKELYEDGGIKRFYRGLPYALIQGPLSRFGSAASNEGAKQLTSPDLLSVKIDSSFRIFMAAIVGSVFNVIWRVLLMPLDTCKIVLQVHGRTGFDTLMERLWQDRAFHLLFQGSKATLLTVFVGHSWFLVCNWLELHIPKVDRKNDSYYTNMMRSAIIGFIASIVSDILSNSIRVVKTVKQALVDHLEEGDVSKPPGYLDIVRTVIQDGGYRSLFGRGLGTRIMSNGVQSILFIVIWKGMKKTAKDRKATLAKKLGILDSTDFPLDVEGNTRPIDTSDSGVDALGDGARGDIVGDMSLDIGGSASMPI